MFIDNRKVSQINRLLTNYVLAFDSISKDEYFDNIFKSVIRLIIPYKRISAFEELTDALINEKEITIEPIQNIISRLRTIFPEEIKQLDVAKYREWIEQNESRWKERIEPIHLDKLFYGLKKEIE
jgi:hypothetical protein